MLGENIAQAAQFVESSNADIGILALSLVLAPPLQSEEGTMKFRHPSIRRLIKLL